MKMIEPQKPHLITLWQPPTFTITRGSSVLARVLCAAFLLCEDKPEWVTPTFDIEPVSGFSHPFETRYSREYVHAMHVIALARDITVALLEKRHAEIIEQFEAEQERLINTLTPQRRCLVDPPHRASWWCLGFDHKLQPNEITNIPFWRFEENFTQRDVAALYKNELRTIKRLTRGKR
jgi:hypothetical protein